MTLRNYTRWTRTPHLAAPGELVADILGMDVKVAAIPGEGIVVLEWQGGKPLNPDEARMIGVRLIEAAALADGERAIRSAPRS